MKKTGITLCLLAMSVGLTSVVSAQTQLPNSDFEDIQSISGVADNGGQPYNYEYDSLGQGWISGNPVNRYLEIDHIFMKDTSFTHSGSHAIVMRTDSIGPVVAVGNAGLGEFVFNESNPFASIVFGAPFADRPHAFAGWYTYKSVGGVAPSDGDDRLINGDSLLILCYLTKWNSTLEKRDTVALASWTSSETVTDYTEFIIPFNYFSSDVPDSANVMFLSSSLGYVADFSERPFGVKGSTLVIDDIRMHYSGAGFDEYAELNGTAYTVGKKVVVRLEELPSDASVRIVDMAGRNLVSRQLSDKESTFELAYSGIAFVIVRSEKGTLTRKLYIH